MNVDKGNKRLTDGIEGDIINDTTNYGQTQRPRIEGQPRLLLTAPPATTTSTTPSNVDFINADTNTTYSNPVSTGQLPQPANCFFPNASFDIGRSGSAIPTPARTPEPQPQNARANSLPPYSSSSPVSLPPRAASVPPNQPFNWSAPPVPPAIPIAQPPVPMDAAPAVAPRPKVYSAPPPVVLKLGSKKHTKEYTEIEQLAAILKISMTDFTGITNKATLALLKKIDRTNGEIKGINLRLPLDERAKPPIYCRAIYQELTTFIAFQSAFLKDMKDKLKRIEDAEARQHDDEAIAATTPTQEFAGTEDQQ